MTAELLLRLHPFLWCIHFHPPPSELLIESEQLGYSSSYPTPVMTNDSPYNRFTVYFWVIHCSHTNSYWSFSTEARDATQSDGHIRLYCHDEASSWSSCSTIGFASGKLDTPRKTCVKAKRKLVFAPYVKLRFFLRAKPLGQTGIVRRVTKR